MSELVLFSLDVLVNMPALYANALFKALDGKLPRESILERLADCNLNALAVINEFFSSPARPKMPAMIGTFIEKLGYSKPVSDAYGKFCQFLPEGAHNCVKPRAFDLLRGLRNYRNGVFYQLPESDLRKIARNSKLDRAGIEIIAGNDPETEIINIIMKAQRIAGAEKTWLVAKDPDRNPQYKLIAGEVNAFYIPCTEIYEAPFATVSRRLNL